MKTIPYTRLLLLILLINYTFLAAFSQIPTDGLIGYYQFDGNAQDSSGLEHHGTIIGNVSSTQGHNGDEDGALLFDGGYIDLGNPLDFQMTDSISISVWINPVEISDWQAIVSKWSGFDSSGYYLGINPNGNLIRWNLDMPNPIDGNPVQTNEWTHIVASHDGDTTKLYMNGQLVNQEIYDQLITDNIANVFIGSQYNIPNEFTFLGAMDDVLIYNRALRKDEVLDIFNFIPTAVSSLHNSNYKVSLYPNPIDDFLYLKNDTNFENILYTVIDAQGKNIRNGVFDQYRIDLSSLAPGIYFILLIIDNDIVSKKIVLK